MTYLRGIASLEHVWTPKTRFWTHHLVRNGKHGLRIHLLFTVRIVIVCLFNRIEYPRFPRIIANAGYKDIPVSIPSREKSEQ